MTHTIRQTQILLSKSCPFCGGTKPRGQMLCRYCGLLENVSPAYLLGFSDGVAGECCSRREAEEMFPTFCDDELQRYLNGRDEAAARHAARMEG